MERDSQMMLLESLFDTLWDIVFCVKDLDCRYVSVNQAFATRVNAVSKQSMIGRTAADFFRSELALVYEQQDQQLFETGKSVVDQLEQITNSDGSVGWYLANKFPLRDENHVVIGLVGVSQDLHAPNDSELKIANLGRVVEAIKASLAQPMKVEALAQIIGLSPEQLDRRMKKIFRLSTKKFIIKCRLEHSADLLSSTKLSLVEIASHCGFSDQSAFTRQFRATFLTTPANYRQAWLK